jgi:hypothetical protein
VPILGFNVEPIPGTAGTIDFDLHNAGLVHGRG